MPPTALFASTDDEQWRCHRDLLDSEGMLRFTVGGFLVRSGNRVALVDLGAGPAPDGATGFDGGRFMQSLAGLGVDPTQVTDVILTHLHYDHVGWSAPAGQPTFPRATYRCHLADWEHFVVQNPGLESGLIEGAADRFEMWSGDAPIGPGMDARWAPGHTPGSTVVVLSSGTDRALLLGDVVHCAVELVDEEWDTIYDVDPELAMRTRVALAREIEGERLPVAAAHFPDLQFGRLLPGQGRRLWSV